MKLLIGYDAERRRAVVEYADAFNASVWGRLTDEARAADPTSISGNDSIELSWAAVLRCIHRLSSLQKRLGFQFDASDDLAKQMILDHVKRARRISEVRNGLTAQGDENSVQDKLDGLGFTRQLLPYQRRDLARLIALPNGANFSVPGSGKTTVTFGVHLLTKSPETKLLVVAPKNAFSAWDDVVTDCLSPDAAHFDPFVRLDSLSLANPYSIDLRRNHFIVSYDIAARNPDTLGDFLARAPFHVVLDESHRIKAGEGALRGAALLNVSTLPARKDILSGTPAPNSQHDLEPQIEFLWPGMSFSEDIAEAAIPRDVLRNLFVRTTKSELGLRKPDVKYIPIQMGSEQMMLYSLLRNHSIRQIMESRQPGSAAQLRARKCVMYFLMSSINPIATVRALSSGTNIVPLTPDTQAVYQAVIESGDSNKMTAVCDQVRALAREGKKSVVWTIFRATLERLEYLLRDLNPVTLHGKVPTGASDDLGTREGRIKRFHESSEDAAEVSWVMIANPAAASEGISLHKVCHDAIYADRSYNAAHYLQSLDRINRIGLEPDQETNVYIFESVAPVGIGSIDYSVRVRLRTKIRGMQHLLDDDDLGVLADFEDEAEIPVDATIDLEDLADVLEELTARRPAPADDDE